MARLGLRRPGSTAWSGRALAGALAAIVLVAGYMLWFRDSGLVAISHVKVEGVTSADREQVVGALTRSAEGMTTLDVDNQALATVAGHFPTVASVSVDTSFPHGATIHVTERRPALILRAGDHQVAAAADGTVLAGLPQGDVQLPVVAVSQLPGGPRLEGGLLEEAKAVGAAPDPLLAQIAGVAVDKQYGVVATLREGIQVRLGTGPDAARKWAAAAAVLSNPKLTSLSYLDVRVPERPAVGGAPALPAVVPTTPNPLDATNPAAPPTVPTTTTPLGG